LLAAPSTWGFGQTPLLLGSGKFGTPLERMQREKASGWESTDWVFVGPPAFDVPVEGGLPPHAAASRARTAVTTMAAALCEPAGRAPSGPRLTRGCSSSCWSQE
jgi:hypothetical protein